MSTSNEFRKVWQAIAELGGRSPEDVKNRRTLEEKVHQMTLNFDRLRQEVQEMGTVVEGVVATLKTVAEDMRNSAQNQQAIDELANQLDAQAGTLSQAITSGTQAEPEPGPAPETVEPVADAITPTE